MGQPTEITNKRTIPTPRSTQHTDPLEQPQLDLFQLIIRPRTIATHRDINIKTIIKIIIIDKLIRIIIKVNNIINSTSNINNIISITNNRTTNSNNIIINNNSNNTNSNNNNNITIPKLHYILLIPITGTPNTQVIRRNKPIPIIQAIYTGRVTPASQVTWDMCFPMVLYKLVQQLGQLPHTPRHLQEDIHRIEKEIPTVR